ncbi:hypothetical protein RJ640_016592 [Escallonia rubra]|uniref:Fe2OG dioxygenase domain-containing protein n=1 Tax=Escallonia rubra TaxID=112253 RepID=A0AA88RSX6_9ASTE|nr:hypothetical protein RJ640_016592 [Escallonia rubra]
MPEVDSLDGASLVELSGPESMAVEACNCGPLTGRVDESAEPESILPLRALRRGHNRSIVSKLRPPLALLRCVWNTAFFAISPSALARLLISSASSPTITRLTAFCIASLFTKTSFSWNHLDHLSEPIATPILTPSVRNFSLKSCSAKSGHVTIGTPAVTPSSIEFHPQSCIFATLWQASFDGREFDLANTDFNVELFISFDCFGEVGCIEGCRNYACLHTKPSKLPGHVYKWDQVPGRQKREKIDVKLIRFRIHGRLIQHNGGWVPINPLPNSLVVNVGDLLEIWSNGKYKSIEHRVVTSEARARISVALFFYPNTEVEIEPLEDILATQECGRMYKKVKYGDYLKQVTQRRLQGKTHILKFKI